MFALAPWTRRALLPRVDFPDDFGSMFNRLISALPITEAPEWPNGWGVTTEEKPGEFIIRMELPGFDPAEVAVNLTGDRLTVEAEHKEPNAKPDGRAYAHVKRMMTLPPELELEKVEATYHNGVLEFHVPRIPEAVGRRIEVKT